MDLSNGFITEKFSVSKIIFKILQLKSAMLVSWLVFENQGKVFLEYQRLTNLRWYLLACLSMISIVKGRRIVTAIVRTAEIASIRYR